MSAPPRIVLTPRDRLDTAKIAHSMASNLFDDAKGEDFLVGDKVHLTQEMLTHLIKTALELGIDIGRTAS